MGDSIDRYELLKAMDTFPKYGYDEELNLVYDPNVEYVPYVHYEDIVECVKNMPSLKCSVTDEKLIEILQKFHDKCDKTGCADCYFRNKELCDDYSDLEACVFYDLAGEIGGGTPMEWNIENIAKILKEFASI